jgi:hypothetical protein
MPTRKFYSRACPLCGSISTAEFGKRWTCCYAKCSGQWSGPDPDVKSIKIELTADELERVERLAEVMNGTPGDVIGAAIMSYANAQHGRRRKGRASAR